MLKMFIRHAIAMRLAAHADKLSTRAHAEYMRGNYATGAILNNRVINVRMQAEYLTR